MGCWLTVAEERERERVEGRKKNNENERHSTEGTN